MWAKRSQEYLAKINTGDPSALAEVVRDLQSAADGSGSSFSQRNLFELALAAAIEMLNQALADARAKNSIERQAPIVGV
jgi:CarD family transcriptional regulator